MIRKYLNIKSIVDVLIVILLIILSVQKGGFYKSDVIFFNLAVNILAIVSIMYTFFVEENKKIFKDNIGNTLLLLSLSYSLAIIFRNYSSLNDSIFEFIRYFNVYLIYTIVRNSNKKNIYMDGIIIIAIFLVILGIDQLGNGVLENYLNNHGSGYLHSNNLDRMSSTIQYANVFALICFIAYIFDIEKIKEKNNFKYINYTIMFLLNLGIILSQSRIIILLYIIYNILFFYLNKDKKCMLKNISIFLYSLVCSMFIFNILNNDNGIIYIIIGSFVILLNILIYILEYIYSNNGLQYIKKLYDKLKIKEGKNKKIVSYILIAILITIYLIIAFNTFMPITIDNNSNVTYITRDMYNIKNENELEIQIDRIEDDTRYEVEIFQVDSNDNFYIFDKVQYYSTTTDIFNYNVEPIDNLKYIKVNINCYKGRIKVKNLVLNNKKYTNYILLPNNIIYRFKEALKSNNSQSLRLEYIKDSFKIIFLNKKNFTIGIGGEGFRNEYKYYKNIDYFSTEVHNIYIQMLLESGIVGLICFIYLIIYTLKKYKVNYKMITFIIVMLHGLFDLDFSYMIILSILGIILGLLDEKNIKAQKIHKNKHIIINKQIVKYIENSIKNIFICILLIMYIITTTLLIKSNIAVIIYGFNEEKNDIVSNIEKYEKMINYDSYEISYRINLNKLYEDYLDENIDKIDSDSYTNIINNIDKNLNYLLLNENTNPSNSYDITNSFFYCMEYLIKLNYKEDKDTGYKYYLDIVYNNLLKLYNTNDESLKNKAIGLAKKYTEYLSNIDNQNVKKYEVLLENIV